MPPPVAREGRCEFLDFVGLGGMGSLRLLIFAVWVVDEVYGTYTSGYVLQIVFPLDYCSTPLLVCNRMQTNRLKKKVHSPMMTMFFSP